MLPFCKVIFHTVPLLFVSSSLKRKSGFYMKRKTKPQSHQTKGGLRKSRSQTLDPMGMQSLWCSESLSAPAAVFELTPDLKGATEFQLCSGRAMVQGNTVQPSRELPELRTVGCMPWSIRCTSQMVVLPFALIHTTICLNVSFCFILYSQEESIGNGEGRPRAENCSFVCITENIGCAGNIPLTGLILSARLISMSSIVFSSYWNMIKIEHLEDYVYRTRVKWRVEVIVQIIQAKQNGTK